MAVVCWRFFHASLKFFVLVWNVKVQSLSMQKNCIKQRNTENSYLQNGTTQLKTSMSSVWNSFSHCSNNQGVFTYSSSQQQSSSSNYKKLHNHWHQQPGLQRSLVTPLRALAGHLEVHRASIPKTIKLEFNLYMFFWDYE